MRHVWNPSEVVSSMGDSAPTWVEDFSVLIFLILFLSHLFAASAVKENTFLSARANAQYWKGTPSMEGRKKPTEQAQIGALKVTQNPAGYKLASLLNARAWFRAPSLPTIVFLSSCFRSDRSEFVCGTPFFCELFFGFPSKYVRTHRYILGGQKEENKVSPLNCDY